MPSRRKVTTLTRKRAFETIKVIASAMLNGEVAITYSELARRLALPNETGRGLGDVLGEAAAMCIERGLPDVSAVVVTKESFARGAPMPSLDSFKDGEWPLTGLTLKDIPAEQDKVRLYDWRSVRELSLA